MSRSSEVKLRPPRLVPLTAEHESEVVALLAELLLDIARKRRTSVSGSASVGASERVSGSVVPLPKDAGKARKAA